MTIGECERMTGAVDRSKLPKLRRAEARLRPVEARAARPLAQTLEEAHDGANVAVAQGPDEDDGVVLRLERSGVHSSLSSRPGVCRHPTAGLLREVAVDELGRHRSFPDRGCDSFDRTVPYVAGEEDTRLA